LPIIGKESLSQTRKLLDELQKHMRALKSYNLPVDTWDTLLIHLIKEKLDSTTKKLWLSEVEKNHKNDRSSLPSMDEFIDFLSQRCVLLEALETTRASDIKIDYSNKFKFGNKNTTSTRSFVTNTQNDGQHNAQTQNSHFSCPVCSEKHLIYYCNKFREMSVDNKRKEIEKLKLCWNCLKFGHNVQSCVASGCRKC